MGLGGEPQKTEETDWGQTVYVKLRGLDLISLKQQQQQQKEVQEFLNSTETYQIHFLRR